MSTGPTKCQILVINVAMAFATLFSACIPPSQAPFASYELCSSSWYGIVPGTTDVGTAIEILGTLSFVDGRSIEYITSEIEGAEATVVWQQYAGIPARRNGTMLVHDGVVIAIQAPLPFELSLKQALLDCGEPILVRASFDGESPFHWYQFFYPTKGILLLGRFEREQLDNAILTPEIRIVEAVFFLPGDISAYLMNIRHFTSRETAEAYAEEFVPWPGLNETIPAYSF
ncbi:MAG: hypothetical protein GXP37_14230 [Chloroflexi bacterium]|nr:hypothetical protein [Chloroflexota bacterium]